MSATKVGTVTSPSNNKTYEVKWDSSNKDAYVSYAGWSAIGKAKSASEAKNKAVSWLAQNS